MTDTVDSTKGQGQLVLAKGRASLSSDKLARPVSSIHLLASRIQDYIYFPSPDPLYVVLGTIAANMMKGSPVWVVLIGAPSSGRTLLLETVSEIDPKRILIVGAIKSPAALLSGVPRKEHSKDATGGLLRALGSRGLLIMKDFTSMMSLPREPLSEAISALRETFDGRYSRPLGGEGGKLLEWRGKIGFLAASTNAIDRHSGLIGDLGERWIYYRYPETDGYGETIKALGNTDPETMMKELRDLVTMFFDSLGLDWLNSEKRELSFQEKNRFYSMASLVVAARSSVPRDRYQGNEVSDIALKESSPRIATELSQLYLGLERIGLDEEDRWRIIGKIAVDSVRQLRMMILLLLRANEGPVKIGKLYEICKCGQRTIREAVEDLTIHGLVEKTGRMENRAGGEEGTVGGVRLTKWCMRQFDLGFGVIGKGQEEED